MYIFATILLFLPLLSYNSIFVSGEFIQKVGIERGPDVNLKHLVDRFSILIDSDKISDWIATKLNTDPEAQELFLYLKSEHAKSIITYLWNEPPFTQFIRWTYDNGLTNIYNEVNKIHSIFGWDPVKLSLKERKYSLISQNENILDAQTMEKMNKITEINSLKTLMTEFCEQLPINLITALAIELISTQDPTAFALIGRLRDPSMSYFWRELKEFPPAQEVAQGMIEGGIDLNSFIMLIEAFFGW